MPKIFGILIGIAGIGYIADLIGLVVVPGFTPIFWLLIGGHRLPRS